MLLAFTSANAFQAIGVVLIFVAVIGHVLRVRSRHTSRPGCTFHQGRPAWVGHIGDGFHTSFCITADAHDCGNGSPGLPHQASLRDAKSGQTVWADVRISFNGDVTVEFAFPPAIAGYELTIIG